MGSKICLKTSPECPKSPHNKDKALKPCSETEFEYEVEDDLDTEEVEDTSNSKELKYTCPFLICNEKFLWSTDLMEHVQESHTPRTNKG